MLQYRATLKGSNSDLLDASATPSIKSSVRVKLDEVADKSQTLIAVVNEDAPPVESYWTDLERMCDIAITGPGIDYIEVARIRVLVMLDELVRTLQPYVNSFLNCHRLSRLGSPRTSARLIISSIQFWQADVGVL